MRLTPRIHLTLLMSIMLGLLATACMPSSSAKTDPDYKFQEGEISRYTYQTTQKGKVTIDGETETFDLRMVNTISQKTDKVDEQGVATVTSSYEDSMLTVDGEDLPLPELLNTNVTYEIDGNGAIANVRGTHGLAGPLGERQFDPSQIFQFQGPVFRGGVLTKGDRWRQPVTVPLPGAGEIDAIIEYTYEGMEKVNGQDAAKTSFTFDAPIDFAFNEVGDEARIVGQEQIKGTALFSLKDGRTIQAVGSGPLVLAINMPSEGGGESVERLKVEIEVDFDYQLQDQK